MSRRSTRTLLILTSLATVLLISSAWPAELNYMGQRPSDEVSSQYSGSGSLYTGQYSQSFPLVSIGTGGGPQVSFGLHYSSNFHGVVDFENRDHQTSWVGLGFEMGGEAIIVDHHYTMDLHDDEYYFLGGGGPVKLLKEDDHYIPADGSLWVITRQTQLLNGRDHIIGWTVQKEDGTLYQFGDSTVYTNSRNATRYTLSWGGSVGVGATGGDSLVAYQWDVRRITNIQSTRWLDYSYSQELDSVRVVNAANNNFSDNYYTRCSYPASIASSLGDSIVFALEDRIDYQRYNDNITAEFFATKRLRSISTRDHDGEQLSVIDLYYSYLNNSASDEYKKSLLDSMAVMTGDSTASLPSTRFTYYRDDIDIHKGAMKSVEFATGGVYEMTYADVTQSHPYDILKALDWEDHSPLKKYSARAWSRNLYVGKYIYNNTDRRFEVGCWNGYWAYEDMNDLIDQYNRTDLLDDHQYEVAASDSWVVIFKRNIAKLIVLENRGGAWLRDTIDISWTPESNGYVELFAGDRYFIACDLFHDSTHVQLLPPSSYNRYHHYTKLNEAYYYCKTDAGWTEHQILTDEVGHYFNVSLGNDLFAIYRYVTAEGLRYGALDYGKFNFTSGSLYTHSVRINDQQFVHGLYGEAGINYVAFARLDFQDPVWIANADGPTMTEIACFFPDGDSTWVRHLAPMRSNIFIYSSPYENLGDSPLRVGGFLHRSANGWSDWGTTQLNGTFHPDAYAGDTYTLTHTNDATHYEYLANWWDGDHFPGLEVTPYEGGEECFMFASDDIITANVEETNSVWALRRLANGQWSASEQVASSLWDSHLSASRDIVASGKYRKLYRHYGGSWQERDLSSYIYTASCDSTSMYPLYDNTWTPYSTENGEYGRAAAYADRVSFATSDKGRASFQLYRGDWTGRPEVPVLSEIRRKAYSDDTHPVVQTFEYSGGILDVGTVGPRFSRVTASTPYYVGDSPDGYSITCYFNDLDQVPVEGVNGAAHLLDGAVYYAYDSSASDPAGTLFDYAKYDYEVFKYSDLGGGIYKPLTTRKETRVDSTVSEQNYSYDNSGRLVSTRTPLYDDKVRVDTMVYDDSWDDDVNLRTQVALRQSWIDSLGARSHLSRSYTGYYEDGSGVAYTAVWPDASFQGDSIAWFWTEVFDTTVYDTSPTSYSLTITPDWQTDGWDSCVYLLEIDGQHIPEYCEITKDGVSVVRLDAYLDETIHGCQDSHIYAAGTFDCSDLDDGDPVSWTISNDVGRWCDLVDSSWCRARLVFYGTADRSSQELFTYRVVEDLPNNGMDEYGNVLAWTDVYGDTASVKYSPDGTHKVAAIANGFTNNVFVFDAEYDFDQGVGYDGWVNKAGVDGTLTDADAISGERSFSVATPLTSMVGLSRGIQIDSLVRSDYVMSFWARSSDIVDITVDEWISGSSTRIITEQRSGGQFEWTKHDVLLHIGDSLSVGVDSITVSLGITYDQSGSQVSYFDNIRFQPIDAVVVTSTYNPSTHQVTSSSGAANIPALTEYDNFYRPYRTRDCDSNLLSETEYHYSRLESVDGNYDPVLPNYTKSTTYSQAGQASSVAFSDGLGRALQTRSEVEVAGATKIAVSGHRILDGRGRVTKSYLPYVDLWSAKVLTDYCSPAIYETEANSFYNGTYAPSCGGYEYSESVYGTDIKGLLTESSAPTPDFALGAGHTVHYDQETEFVVDGNEADTLLYSSVTDQDGLVTATRTDHRGRSSSQVNYYLRDGLTPDSLVVTTYPDIMAQSSVTEIDTGGVAAIPLRRAYSNDLGQVDSTWKVDYGTVRLLYDDSGNLRFMQNDMRKIEGAFVYYKYDAQGRRTEEGVISDTHGIYFSQAFASQRSFPDGVPGTTVKYQWFYDYYEDAQYALLSPGKLVRVQNATGTYFKNFYYHPEDLCDSTIVKLPFTSGGSLKKITHRYNFDGSLAELEVCPNMNYQHLKRTFLYTYDITGRLKSIAEGDASPLTLAEYTYAATGDLNKMRLGVDPITDDEIQEVNYGYDGLGRLTSINDTGTVLAATSGVGSANDHFGQAIIYRDDVAQKGYYNGRIYNCKYTSSAGVATASYDYYYGYSDLGWLEQAYIGHDNQLGALEGSREYLYNELGQRVEIDVKDSNGNYGSIGYDYYTNTPGSSRLLRDATMGIYNALLYDSLGNLVKDEFRGLDTLTYDYRNLNDYVFMESQDYPGYHEILRFDYDQSGMRIKKNYRYWGSYYDETCNCPDVEDSLIVGSGLLGGGFFMAMGGGIPIDTIGECDGDWCQYGRSSEKLYLYDGGVLIATFAANDGVYDFFVNGPGGRIATYHQNDDSKLYFYLNDHLGNTRSVVGASGQVQYYAYHPFGETIEASGSFNTEFQFTGKERDDHGAFQLDYFGARYYNPSYGSFTTLDKASQFASGYIYGANNPISMVDPDGNWVIGALAYALTGYAVGTSIVNHDYLGAGLSLAMAFLPIGVPHVYSGSNVVYGIADGALTSVANYSIMNGLREQPITLRGALGAGATGAVSGLVSSEQFNNWADGNGWNTNREVAINEWFNGSTPGFDTKSLGDLNARQEALDALDDRFEVEARRLRGLPPAEGGPMLACNGIVGAMNTPWGQAAGHGALEALYDIPTGLWNTAVRAASVAGRNYSMVGTSMFFAPHYSEVMESWMGSGWDYWRETPGAEIVNQASYWTTNVFIAAATGYGSGLRIVARGGAKFHYGLDLVGGRNLVHFGRDPRWGVHLAFGWIRPYFAAVHYYPSVRLTSSLPYLLIQVRRWPEK